MKSEKQIERRILELSAQLPGQEGSQAHAIRKQMEALNWVLDRLPKKKGRKILYE